MLKERKWSVMWKQRGLTKGLFSAFTPRIDTSQNLYEVLSPSAFLRPYLDDYQALTDLYILVRRDIDTVSVDKELTRKTRELLHAHTTSSPLELPGVIRELGPDELAVLKQSHVSDMIKLLNLRKLLKVVVEERARYEPHVIPHWGAN